MIEYYMTTGAFWLLFAQTLYFRHESQCLAFGICAICLAIRLGEHWE